MEPLVTNRIRYEAETHRLLSENQAGFRNGHSTEDQLLRLSQSISDGFQCSPKKRTISVRTLIDYSRLYSHVRRETHLLKILHKCVTLHLIRWIQARQANLQSWVNYEDVKSKKTILRQGVRQGSVPSPLLLLFYIDDLHWGSGTYTLDILLTMLQSGHRTLNSTLQTRDYNRAWMQ